MGRTPTRGFGGRIFMYDEKSNAVPVEGTLIVHGFHDQAKSPSDAVKRFEFTPEQFTRHFSQTDLGASYSVWIPWDAMGGAEKRVTLVPTFKTTEGKSVQGVPATVLLPGTKPEETAEDKMARFSPDYRQYKNALDSNTPATSGLTTTTIKRQRRRISGPKIQESLPSRDLLIAGSKQTPSAEIPSLGRPNQSTIRPVSAQEPLKR
jgi:hypothetical protein